MKLSLVVLIAAVLTLMSLSSLSSFGNCEYSREITREVSLGESKRLEVIAGAGSLGIKGDESRDKVLIKAKLCAQSESKLAEMDVSSKLKSGLLTLETEFSKKAFWGFSNDEAHINLEVYVPAASVLEVVDSSGAASVEGIKSLVMEDSSGDLIITDVTGDVRVKDSSGALRIGGVTGSVWVSDSSGAIKVGSVAGDFTVDVDSSGSIEAKGIQGNVLVRVDSSGFIDVKDVGGNFKVCRDSSGGISHSNVVGTVSLPN